MGGRSLERGSDGGARRMTDVDGPGKPFEHLWTPYRMAYIRGE